MWRCALGMLVATSACAQTIAISRVTVIDVVTGSARAGQTVLIEGGRIVACDASTRVRTPAGARVIDGTGRYLIPGLWDMHTHDLPYPGVGEQFLANGVTGARSMYDDPAKLRAMRGGPGPRFVAPFGPTLNGERERDSQLVVRAPEQARAAVRKQVAEGAEFIKVYNALPREVYYAIADECKRLRIPFAGHTPDAVTTVEAAAAGQRSIEHLDAVLLDCSPLGAWLRRSRRFLPDQRLISSFDAARARGVFAAYVRHGTWHCPTLSLFRAEPALLKKSQEIVAMMHRAGVGLLAGTDTGLPGASLHGELELMEAAGIPAPAVLRIATLAPAQFLGREAELGSVARGKIADLVLLDANPLESIGNTRRIRAVIANGRIVRLN